MSSQQYHPEEAFNSFQDTTNEAEGVGGTFDLPPPPPPPPSFLPPPPFLPFEQATQQMPMPVDLPVTNPSARVATPNLQVPWNPAHPNPFVTPEDLTSSQPQIRAAARQNQADVDPIVNQLKASLANETRTATFAIGGTVPIAGDGTSRDAATRSARPIEPIHIRFGKDGDGKHVVLPSVPVDPAATEDNLASLVEACSPASFGRGKEDVLDETYRKAGKLDTDAFTTSFCPYSAGIIDVISQVLLPSIKFRRDKYDIRAELYKLNVYSAPSGFFKPHVDTPRAESQFGSLVVSLPVEYQGGALIVRHAGNKVTFDWSNSSTSTSAIQWAAFYSDCEHEVLPVTAGHRITLTYNLYMKVSAGHLAGLYTALEPTQLPLYNILKTALSNPNFFPTGIVLGIWLSHNYAHTSETQNFLPSSLKGADMVFYEAAIAAGLQCHLRPYLRSQDEHRDILGGRFVSFDYYEEGEVMEDESRRNLLGFMKAKEGWKEDLVVWLNVDEGGATEAQMVRMVYGNQAELSLEYSKAVMLITVPPFGKRGEPVKQASKKVFEGLCDGSEGYRTEDSENEQMEYW